MKSLMQVAAIGAFLATAAQFSVAAAAETTPAIAPAATTATATAQPVQTAQNAPTTAMPTTRGRKHASQSAVAQPATQKSAWDEAIELNEKIHAFMPALSGDGGGGR